MIGQWIVYGILSGLMFTLIRDIVCAVANIKATIFNLALYCLCAILGGVFAAAMNLIWNLQ